MKREAYMVGVVLVCLLLWCLVEFLVWLSKHVDPTSMRWLE